MGGETTSTLIDICKSCCRDLAEQSEGLLARVDTAVELQRQANGVLTHILGARYTLGRAFQPKSVLPSTSTWMLSCFVCTAITGAWVYSC